jgi:outer membrane lipoprotein carrier protein
MNTSIRAFCLRVLGAAGLLMLMVDVGVALGAAPTKTGSDHLRRFFGEINSCSAQFNQVVLDEALNPIQESSGTLYIERPNKFRWDYDAPLKQQIVSDGKKIWVYDLDLKQVTVRLLTGGLGDTPAVLLAGRGKLEDSFEVKNMGTQGNLDWAQLAPRRKDGGYEDIRVGFEQGKLKVLEMVDGFGQTTRVTLKGMRENAKIDAARFTFSPPPGVDVVGE